MAGGSKDDLAKALEALPSGSSSAHENRELEQAPQAGSVQKSSSLPAGNVQRPARPDSPSAAEMPAEAASPASVSNRSLELKRTIIPLLLTLGVLLPLAGLASLLMGEDSPLGEERTLPLVMLALGLLILGAGITTMLQVKHLLSLRAR